MKKEIKLLQSKFCCILSGKLVYPTEQNGVFIEVDPRTSMAAIMDKENLKNKIDFICCDENAIYLVNIGGKWIAETINGASSINYYELGCCNKTSGNFAYICQYKNELALFLKEENTVVFFDKTTKKVCPTKYNIKETTAQFDSGCLKDDCVYLFSSESKKYYIYSLEKKKIIDQRQLPVEDPVSYVLKHEDKIYILSENVVYDVFNDFREVARVDDPVCCTRMSIVNNTIWLLPGTGDKIYQCNMEDGRYREYDSYPTDYEYDIKEGQEKFVGKAEDDENIYWCMRVNNYILRIDKRSGVEEWISPHVNDAEQLIEKSFFDDNKLIFEGICSLSDLWRHISKQKS